VQFSSFLRFLVAQKREVWRKFIAEAHVYGAMLAQTGPKRAPTVCEWVEGLGAALDSFPASFVLLYFREVA
jgi:hypothetical protein